MEDRITVRKYICSKCNRPGGYKYDNHEKQIICKYCTELYYKKKYLDIKKIEKRVYVLL